MAYTTCPQTSEGSDKPVSEGMKLFITLYTRHRQQCNQTKRDYHKCGCPVWFYDLSKPRGQQRYSSGTNDWNEALRKASVEAENSESNQPIQHITIEKAVNLYLVKRSKKLKDANSAPYKDKYMLRDGSKNQKSLLQWCAENKLLCLEHVSAATLDAWRNGWVLREESYAMKIYNATAKAFFTWAVKFDYLTKNPMDKLDTIHVTEVPTLPLEPEELVKLLACANSCDASRTFTTAILLMRWSGLAITDATCLRRDRLAAGANMDNVEILDKVKVEAITKNVGGNVMTRGKGRKTMLDLKLHTKLLKGLIKKYPDVALILLDPITAFLGVDETKDKDTRPVLESVAEAMHGTLTTLIGIIHSNKMTKGSAGDKVKGGSSMLGVTRTAWAIGCDPDDRDQKYMALIKGNVLRKKTGLRFRIENKVLDQETGLEAGYIVWGDEMLEDANEMLAATRDTNRENGKTRKVDTAKDLILRLLANAPMRSTDIYDRGKEMNISGDTVKEAARQLMKEIGLLRKQRNDGWWMGLAEHKDILWGIGPPVTVAHF